MRNDFCRGPGLWPIFCIESGSNGLGMAKIDGNLASVYYRFPAEVPQNTFGLIDDESDSRSTPNTSIQIVCHKNLIYTCTSFNLSVMSDLQNYR